MINVQIKPNDQGKYDIGVYDHNGELLLFSRQGYENAIDAENVVDHVLTAVDAGEPVKVTTTLVDGNVRSIELS